jgi:hypothetical protein
MPKTTVPLLASTTPPKSEVATPLQTTLLVGTYPSSQYNVTPHYEPAWLRSAPAARHLYPPKVMAHSMAPAPMYHVVTAESTSGLV